jgi:hypothetical protein
MKLQQCVGHGRHAGLHFLGGGVDEQQHRGHKRGQQLGQFGGAVGRHGAWAGRVQHKADRVGPGLDGVAHIVLARQATDLDSGAVHAAIMATSQAGHRIGQAPVRRVDRAQEVQAIGAKVGAATSRLRASRTSAIQSGGRRPWPTATRQPMMLRIMWCKKALASKSKRQ